MQKAANKWDGFGESFRAVKKRETAGNRWFLGGG